MAEYIEREALLNSPITVKGMIGGKFPFEGIPLSAIRNAPAADVAQVVRCENCKYWHISPGTGGNWGECDKIGDRDKEGGASIDLDTYHDDYCSSGAKKEAT